jgi:hypothetical protein
MGCSFLLRSHGVLTSWHEVIILDFGLATKIRSAGRLGKLAVDTRSAGELVINTWSAG